MQSGLMVLRLCGAWQGPYLLLPSLDVCAYDFLQNYDAGILLGPNHGLYLFVRTASPRLS